MKNKELFYKSVNILQKAYFNGTLEHSECTACAVGNLIQGNGYEFAYSLSDSKCPDNWLYFLRKEMRNFSVFPLGVDFVEGKKQLEVTGYEIKDLDRIEKAFESAEKNIYHPIDKDGFKGLCAVLDVLMEIHEFNKEEIKLPDNTKIFNKEELVLIQE